MSWSGGYEEWVDGDTAYLSVVFTWFLDKAYAQALWHRALGRKVRVGGPAMFTMKHELAELDGVAVGGDVKDAIARHNPEATVFSRGCPEGCGFCIVTPMEGKEFTLIPDAPVRPILCDNNLSALPPEFQDYIIERYRAEGVPLRDANSGFEPKTFTEEVYRRWKPLVNAGGGPWRFAYDDMQERDVARRVMRMLKDEPAISDVRDALFKVLEGLTDPDKPMDIERARAVNETAQVIINSAKVEVDFLKVVHGDGEVPFITGPSEAPTPQQQTALPSAPADPLASGPAPGHPWRATVHKLKG